MEKISRPKRMLQIAVKEAQAKYRKLKRDSEDAQLKAQVQQEHAWELEKIMDDLD